jgi:hypothetical protein
MKEKKNICMAHSLLDHSCRRAEPRNGDVMTETNPAITAVRVSLNHFPKKKKKHDKKSDASRDQHDTCAGRKARKVSDNSEDPAMSLVHSRLSTN